MKAALIQQAIRTATGTQDWTDASVVNDMQAALFFGTNAVANDTPTAQSSLIIGATDLVGNVATCSNVLDDNVTGANSRRTNSNAASLTHVLPTGTVDLLAASITGLPNGVTLNYSTAATAAFLMNALMLSGADLELKVSSVTFSTTDLVKTVTHGLGDVPDVIIMCAAHGVGVFPGTGANVETYGFWERGGTAAGAGHVYANGASPPGATAKMTTDLGHQCSGGLDNYTYSLTNVNATTFDLNRSATLSAANTVVLISMRGRRRPMFAQAGAFMTPAATGNSTPIAGMAGAPQVLMLLGTRLLDVGVIRINDAAGEVGLGIAVNNAGVTQQMAAAASSQIAINPSVSRSYTSASQALVIIDGPAGALKVAATVSSWNNDGVTLNYSVVDAASPRAVAYLAFGLPDVGPLLSARGIIALQ